MKEANAFFSVVSFGSDLQVTDYPLTEIVLDEKHGVWDPKIPELAITHLTSYSQLRSQISTPITKGKECSRKISPIG